VRLTIAVNAKQSNTALDLADIVKYMASRLNALLGQTVRLRIATGDIPIIVRGDRSDIEDIIAELLTVIAAAAPERSTVTVTTSNVEIVEQKESFYFGRSPGACGIVSVCCSGLDE
jgi:hypothetical protein